MRAFKELTMSNRASQTLCAWLAVDPHLNYPKELFTLLEASVQVSPGETVVVGTARRPRRAGEGEPSDAAHEVLLSVAE